MPVTIDATVGGVSANSFITQAEADAYFARRLPLNPPWDDADDPTAAIVMATSVLVRMFAGQKKLVADKPPYYLTGPTWTGAPATTTQRLPWPRSGMYDINGNAIATNVIPQELKDAQAELAGQLILSDSTLNNDVIVQGLTSVRAGSVALTFKDNFSAQVIPDAVLYLLVPSWITDEIYTPAQQALFDVINGNIS